MQVTTVGLDLVFDPGKIFNPGKPLQDTDSYLPGLL